MKEILVDEYFKASKDFTGIAQFPNEDREWYKEGKLHRIDGPAIEYWTGEKSWWIENKVYHSSLLSFLIETSVFLGKEKGKHNLDWLRFLIETGIEEFPVIPEMEEDKDFKPLFKQVFGAPSK